MRKVSPEYIHVKNQDYSSKAEIRSICNICFISLDTYDEVSQNKDIETPLDAWLTFLSAKSFTRIRQLIEMYPEFLEMYQEIAAFRGRTKELIEQLQAKLQASEQA